MKLEKYNKYKSLDAQWLQIIPEHWTVDRIKNQGSVNGRVGWKALKASEYVDSGYFFLSTPNIKHRQIDYKNVNYITYERYIESPEIMLKNGDILLVKDGSTLGIVNIVKELPSEGTVNSSIAVLRFKHLINNYVFYLISSQYIQNVVALKKEGMGVPHLFQRDINNFSLLIPPQKEQTQIAQYLDQKTQAIDQKIDLLDQKVAHYQTLLKSLINETVCRGLDKNVLLKESGIDWIRKVPEHWQICRIQEIFEERSEKVSDRDYPPLSVTMQGIVPQLSTAAKTKNGDNRKKVVKGDFVINSRSDRKGSSGLSEFTGSVSVISIVLKVQKTAFGKYFHFLFKSQIFTEEFYRQGKGIVDDLWSTKYSAMKNIQVQLPPLEEQQKIADYLNQKTTIIDKIITNLKKQLEIHQELRKTLINELVTGQLKVPQT